MKTQLILMLLFLVSFEGKNSDIQKPKMQKQINIIRTGTVYGCFTFMNAFHVVLKKKIFAFERKLLLTIVEKMNFTYAVQFSIDPFQGKKVNGTWIGILGMLQRKEIDLGVCGIGISYDRFNDFSFSSLYLNDKVVFYLRSPTEKPRISAFLHSFSPVLWIGVVLSLPITTFIILYLSKFYSKMRQNQQQNFFSIFWSLFSSIISQESSNALWYSTPFRLIFVVWLIYSLIITSSYSGTLISLLTLPSYEDYPQNFIQLAEACRLNIYDCGTISDTIVYQNIMNGQTDLEKSLATSMIRDKENAIENLLTGLERVQEKKFALIIPETATNIYTFKYKEKIVASKDSLYTLFAGMVYNKNASFPKQFNIIIGRLMATGIMQKWADENLMVEKENQKEIVNQVIKLEHLQGAFCLLLTGYVISGVAFICEWLLFKCLNRKTGVI